MNSDQINLDQLQCNWKQVKWSVSGELTDDHSNVIDGKHDQVIGKIHEIARGPAQNRAEHRTSDGSDESDPTEILWAS
jgi:uncharacterized protein YjbJ (UPF0337 family)